jgi:putative aminopeptidase FrvX
VLRQPEQEVGEVDAGVQAGEDEGSAGVRVGARGGANVAVVAAEAERLAAARLDDRVADRNGAID